ncbi:splicing factor ESS-2 homolog [Culicoides brevitarsis]|uniref:splicing factor ESS-2 homolog n=1 Tax=Culicoides brevitarsis TaxID=469753 RepID=UPI00307C17F8
MSSKPGEKALLAMKELNKKKVVPEFKRPSLPVIKNTAKKPKYKIISEEEYIEKMGKIIQRDYFPDLSKLKAQNEYLDALASNDLVKLRQIYNKYQTKSPALSRLNSPATFETPLVNTGEETPKNIPTSVRSNKSTSSNSSTKSVCSSHTLDSFLDTYTSEDNQSFQEIIEAADKKLREKYAVLFDAEKQAEELQQKALTLPNISDQFALPAPKTVDYWTYKNQNAVMYTPEGWQLTKAEQIEMAKNKQEICRSNTRLQANPFDETQNKQAIHDAAKASAKTMGDKVGLDGNSIEMGQTPQVRGYSFVKDPSPMPGVDQSPLMTWGEIEGTPFRLDGGDTPLHPTLSGPSFRINEVSKREAIGLQLAGDVTEKARQKKEKAMETAKRNISASPHVRSSFERLASMSPAARRLASAKLGFCSTPSPSRTPTKTPSRPTSLFKKVTPSPLIRKKTPMMKTANTSSAKTESPVPKDTSSLTDNLLALPNKRQKAADFF